LLLNGNGSLSGKGVRLEPISVPESHHSSKQVSSKDPTTCPDDYDSSGADELPEVKWTPLIDMDEK